MKKLLAAGLIGLASCAPNHFQSIVDFYPAKSSIQEKVKEHSNKIFEEEYANRFSMETLWHAHLFTPKSKEKFSGFNDYNKSVNVILYHCKRYDEKNDSLKIENIVGFPDGSISPIEKLIDVNNKKNFEDESYYEDYHKRGIFQASQIIYNADTLAMPSPECGSWTILSEILLLENGEAYFQMRKTNSPLYMDKKEVQKIEKALNPPF